jgi:hypothetical protein
VAIGQGPPQQPVAIGQGPPPPELPQAANNLMCPYCFLTPCVTTYRQRWLGQGQAAQPGNNAIRKKLYKNFWRMMSVLGGWNTEPYREKKERSMENVPYVIIEREIMPHCILKLVRDMYPNPVGVPYMEHKWS